MKLLKILSILVSFSITIRNVSAKSLTEVDSRVFFGEESRPGEQKHLVLLSIQYNTFYMTRCSGSIIGDQWIATAAHCICHTQITFKAKSHSNTDIGYGHIKFSHPNFKTCGVSYVSSIDSVVDVGLLKTENRIQFTDFVQPIRISKSGLKLEDVVTVAGYGQTELTNFPNTPRQAKVSVKQCNVAEDLICTYGVTRPGHGDSGGPVTHNGELVGIVSSGSCQFNLCTTYYAKIEALVKFMRSLKPSFLNLSE